MERRRVSRVSLSTSVQGEKFLFFVACSCCPYIEACSVRFDTKSHFAEKHILDPGQPSFLVKSLLVKAANRQRDGRIGVHGGSMALLCAVNRIARRT